MFHLAGHALPVTNSIIYSVLGLIVGAVIMEAMARFGYLVAGARAFGEGDTLIAAGLGAVFGIKYFFTILLYSIVIQVVAALPVFFKKLYDQKDFRTISALIVFVLYLILFQVISGKATPTSGIVYIIMLAILCIIGIYLCKRILCGIKHEENRTYLPFGPALVTAAFILMFIV
jgi:prepilin signal peptidase PulO-like enzyme (type II secretory pathway)